MRALMLGEIQRQCNFALIGFEEIKKSLEDQGPWDNRKSDRFWYSIQSFLVPVANISKILWPAWPRGSKKLSAETKSQRKKIRKLLGLSDSSPLRIREFRNYFEHYDSELEKWFMNLKDRMIIDSNIIDFDPSETQSDKIFPVRNFNPGEFKLYFKNEE